MYQGNSNKTKNDLLMLDVSVCQTGLPVNRDGTYTRQPALVKDKSLPASAISVQVYMYTIEPLMSPIKVFLRMLGKKRWCFRTTGTKSCRE